MPEISFEITHPTTGETVTAGFDDSGTPAQLIQQLIDQGWLKPLDKGDYKLNVSKENRDLVNDESFASLNVAPDTQLSILTRSGGAAPRRTGPTKGRLKMDWQSLMNIAGRGCIRNIKVFADKQLTEIIQNEQQAHRMRRYLVEYDIPMPSRSRGHQHENIWTVTFDLESAWSTYPSADHKPRVNFVGKAPWHYRVSKNGHLCTNPVGDREYLAAQHVGMIAGLLNADEPFEMKHDKGYDKTCYAYYRSQFKGPINPQLDIPTMDPSLFEVPVAPPVLSLSPREKASMPHQATLTTTPLLTIFHK